MMSLCYMILFFLNLFCNSVIGSESCTCVPFFQCQGGTFNIYGSPDTIEQRISDDDVPRCKETEVCCKLPAEYEMEVENKQDTGNEHEGESSHYGESGLYIVEPSKHDGLAGCGIKRINTRLSSGFSKAMPFIPDKDNTFFGEFPWMVALIQIVNGQEIFLCGGSIISPRFVLTGAHCVNKLNSTSKVIVRAGDWDPTSNIEPIPHQDRYVTTITIHADFDRFNLINDIALVGVNSPFDWSLTVDRICLDDSDDFSPISCVATGWGQPSYNIGEPGQTIMKKVELPIINRKLCQSKLRQTRLGKFFTLHPSFICAGGDTSEDTCKVGDGGGPLICSGYRGNTYRYAQVGIVSWGVGCDRPIPGIYTNVKYFYKWIADRIYL